MGVLNLQLYHYSFPKHDLLSADNALLSDIRVKLKIILADFRAVEHKDPQTGKIYQELTNAIKLEATGVAALYKERWSIEQFFRCIN